DLVDELGGGHLGHDGQAGLGPGLREDLEPLLAKSLERVRARSGLVGAAAQHLPAAPLHDVSSPERLLPALRAAGPGRDDEAPVTRLAVADHHERVVVLELPRRQLERFGYAHDGLDAAKAREVLPQLLGRSRADRADERARLAGADMGREAEALDLGQDLAYRRLIGVLTHDDDHGDLLSRSTGLGRRRLEWRLG